MILGPAPTAIGVEGLHSDCERFVAQGRDVRAGEDVFDFQPREAGEASDDQGIVSGKDLELDANAKESGDGSGRRRLRWVEEGAQYVE